MEALIALTVAAVLSMSFLGSQKRDMDLASGTSITWEHVNFYQEFLAQRSLDRPGEISETWMPWPNREETEWRFTKEEKPFEFVRSIEFARDFGQNLDTEALQDIPEDELPTTTRYTLETRLQGKTMIWEWIGE